MLSKRALEGIASYKYSPGSYTFLDLKLNTFWATIVEWLPMWMAPNLVTMIGTCTMFISTAVELFYTPHFKEVAPSWVYLLSAIGVFLYQTFDAIDGKQARRTGNSSPLGQLFDHGCDAFCTILNALSAFATLQFGPGYRCFIALNAVATTFYMAQWEEYHTGVMSCGNGWYGVTEGQFTLIAAHLATVIFGSTIWTKPILVFLPPAWLFTAGDLLLAALILSNLTLMSGNLYNVFVGSEHKIPKEELGNKQTSKSLALLQLIPIPLLVGLSWFWVYGQDAENYSNYPIMFLAAIGMSYTLLSTRMIVSHMCKVPFNLQFRVLIPLAGVVISNNFFRVVPSLLASGCYVAYVVFVYFHYIVNVVQDICSYLNIYLFKIRKKKE